MKMSTLLDLPLCFFYFKAIFATAIDYFKLLSCKVWILQMIICFFFIWELKDLLCLLKIRDAVFKAAH